LVAHNTQRTPEKIATIAARKKSGQAIELRNFDTDEAERDAIADEIVGKKQYGWGRIAVLARTRALLEAMLMTLKQKGVNAALVQRRDNFISAQFVWLEACLDQALRPTNKRVFTLLVNSANRFTGLELDPLILLAEAEATGSNFLEHWANITTGSTSAVAKQLGALVKSFVQSRGAWKQLVKSAIPILLRTEHVEEGAVGDASEDHTAWLNCMKEIRAEAGQEPDLPELVQGFALRSKEPPLDPNAVGLLTIHTAKGLEFDCVYVIGLAEGEMPSWQSIKKGDSSPEMEEERRSCFVAVTRTKETLHLSYAARYRGFAKKPSRFLEEMSLINT
jgi:DNA helicase-2/ATP-dependent DNA helicase PcrA